MPRTFSISTLGQNQVDLEYSIFDGSLLASVEYPQTEDRPITQHPDWSAELFADYSQDNRDFITAITLQVVPGTGGHADRWLDNPSDAIESNFGAPQTSTIVAKLDGGQSIVEYYGDPAYGHGHSFYTAGGTAPIDTRVELGPPDSALEPDSVTQDWIFGGVQASGNVVFLEQLWSADLHHHDPIRALVLEPATGEQLASFAIRTESSIRAGAYDNSGLWLIILYDDNIVEIHGRDQRFELALEVSNGDQVISIDW